MHPQYPASYPHMLLSCILSIPFYPCRVHILGSAQLPFTQNLKGILSRIEIRRSLARRHHDAFIRGIIGGAQNKAGKVFTLTCRIAVLVRFGHSVAVKAGGGEEARRFAR